VRLFTVEAVSATSSNCGFAPQLRVASHRAHLIEQFAGRARSENYFFSFGKAAILSARTSEKCRLFFCICCRYPREPQEIARKNSAYYDVRRITPMSLCSLMEETKMATQRAGLTIVVAVLSMLIANAVAAQLMSPCVENSPERRGELGCSIIEKKLLPDSLKGPVFLHIDRFDNLELARAAVGSASVAFQAAGLFWLMTIESQMADHHGGHHVAQVGPLPLPRGDKYSMQVQSSRFSAGMYSLVHHHSGVEAVYVIEGEACYETPTRAATLRKGEMHIIPGGTPHRAVVTGSLRHVLAVIVYDAAQPPTVRMEEGTAPKLVSCNQANP
jgi:quercetin dioxygenase-like cupin family protein